MILALEATSFLVPICGFIRHCDDQLPFAQNKTSTRFHGGWIHIQNRGSLLLLLYSARQWQRSSAATIINIFITIQYCGFMQTIGSSGGLSKSGKEKSQQQQQYTYYFSSAAYALFERKGKMLMPHHRYAHT